MIINHNMGAMNANRNMNINAGAASKSMQKLSSGLRINSAADDAAGLAISEKMRGQIRGLDQASANAQGGISMVQTAEGALSETENILQRMRELAVQAGNDTNVGVDRTEIQKEMNQLSSEINRIGNTTEFNTKALLKGDGQSNLDKTTLVTPGQLAGGTAATTTQATQTTTSTLAAAAGDTVAFNLNGIDLTVTFSASGTGAADNTGYNATATSADVDIDGGTPSNNTTATGLKDALEKMIAANDTLKGNYVVSGTGDNVIVSAVQGKMFDGATGVIGAVVLGGTGTMTNTGGAAAVGTNVPADAATKAVDFSSITDGAGAAATDVNLKALVGTGMTIAGKQIEFYNSNDGAYSGDAIGVNISTALANPETGTGDKVSELVKNIAQQVGSKIDGVTLSQNTTVSTLDVTASVAGIAGNTLEVSDGGVQEKFEATLQVGANMGQGFKVDINDMRATALVLTGTAGADATDGAKFTVANSVSNGTDSTLREAALDVSSYENATSAVKVINNAIEAVSSERSKLGAFQNRLEHTIANLGTSSENLTSAESRIRDVDMAKEMSTFSKNNILSQAAQAMLAQANQQPQQVLQLLR